MRRAVPIALAGATLAMFGVAAAAAPLPAQAHERAELFATCSGSLKALATRLHATGDPRAEATERMSVDFEMLLEATLPAALDDGVPERLPERWRHTGWNETAYLLSEVHYAFDAGRSERARAVLRERLNACRDVLLPAG